MSDTLAGGSLGIAGKWSATTAANNLAQGQSNFSVSLWLKVLSFTPAAPASSVFFCDNFTRFAVNIGGPSGLISLAIMGVARVLIYAFPIPIGQGLHVGLAHDGAGTSRIFVNGAEVASKAGCGDTSSNTGKISIAWTSTASCGFLVAHPAIWDGTTLAKERFISLRDCKTNPGSEPTPATSWWPMTSTMGTNPTATDTGMHDLIGLNHFIAIPGYGNDPTSATYSDQEISYTPGLAVADCYVAKSGSIIPFFIGTNPILGAVSQVFPTSVNVDPTVWVNGQQRTLIGPLVSSINAREPWVVYQIDPPVVPSDVVTWSTGDSWISVGASSAGAESGTMANFTGQLERGVFGYLPYDLRDDQKTMNVNAMLVWPENLSFGNYNVVQNIIHRSDQPWIGAATTDATGFPLAIGPGGTAKTNIWNSVNPNGVDDTQTPTPAGIYTLYAKETVPGSPMVVRFISTTSPASIPDQPKCIPGKIVGGIEVGKKWVWRVLPSMNSSTTNLGLQLSIATPDGKPGPNTLRAFYMTAPGNEAAIPDPDNPLAPDLNIVAWLSQDGECPPVIRVDQTVMGFDGISSAVDSEDLMTVDAFSYNRPLLSQLPSDWPITNPALTKSRKVPIYQIRPYDLAVSPKIYFDQPWTNRKASTGPHRFEWSPPSYNWWIPRTDTNWVVAEFVCADKTGRPLNHNLKTGQYVDLPLGIPPLSVITNRGTYSIPIALARITPIITGPSTFIGLFYGSGVPAGNLGNAASPTVYNTTATIIVPEQGVMPIEAPFALAKALGNCGVWTGVPIGSTDECVAVQAARQYARHTPGQKVYPQLANEVLVSYGNPQAMLSLAFGAIQGLSPTKAYFKRAAEVHAIFRTVFGADAGDIVAVFQVFAEDGYSIINGVPCANTTLEALRFANDPANNGAPGMEPFRVDLVTCGSYVDMDESPSFQMAAAAIAINCPDSIAYGSGRPAMPLAGWHDIYRLHTKYGNHFNGATGTIQRHRNAIDQSGYGPILNGVVQPLPRFGLYELSINSAIPSGVSRTDCRLRARLSHDFNYHSEAYYSEEALLAYAQCPGPIGTPGATFATIQSICCARGLAGNAYVVPGPPPMGGRDSPFVTLWPRFTHAAQKKGRGLSNKFWIDDGKCHDIDNESVTHQTDMDWIFAAKRNRS